MKTVKSMDALAEKVVKVMSPGRKRGRPVSPQSLQAKKDKILLDLAEKMMVGLEQFATMLPDAIAVAGKELKAGNWATAQWILEKVYGKPTEKLETKRSDDDPLVGLLREIRDVRKEAHVIEGRVESDIREAERLTNASDVGTILRQELAEIGDGRGG